MGRQGGEAPGGEPGARTRTHPDTALPAPPGALLPGRRRAQHLGLRLALEQEHQAGDAFTCWDGLMRKHVPQTLTRMTWDWRATRGGARLAAGHAACAAPLPRLRVNRLGYGPGHCLPASWPRQSGRDHERLCTLVRPQRRGRRPGYGCSHGPEGKVSGCQSGAKFGCGRRTRA